jgi:hypothetical protein
MLTKRYSSNSSNGHKNRPDGATYGPLGKDLDKDMAAGRGIGEGPMRPGNFFLPDPDPGGIVINVWLHLPQNGQQGL